MTDLIEKLCHGGEETVFCPRCIGVWAGVALALPAAPFAKRNIPLFMWILLGIFFFQMPALGYGEVPLPETVKALSGQLFALSAVFGLVLCPARRWLKRDRKRNAWGPFMAIGAAGVLLLQGLLSWNTGLAHASLDVLSITGFFIALILAIICLVAIGVTPGQKA